ncbi:MAG TPA: ATP-binding protein [Gammaproteobacteria bacterium]
MNSFLSRLSLKWKFVFVVVLIMLSISIVQNMVFHLRDIQDFTRSIQNRVSTLAEVLADNSTSAVQFRSRQDAVQLLNSLRHEPSVRQAYLFTADGQVLAEYLAEGEKLTVPLIDIDRTASITSTDNRIIVRHPVILDQQLVGALYMSVDIQELRERVYARMIFGLVVLLGIAVVAFGVTLWSQKFFLQPIFNLSRLSYEIGQNKNYSLRARKTSNDEWGVLVENFNAMLDAIQERDQALARKSQELEYSNKELEQFAYVISHDLKSPLVTIQGFAGRFMKYVEDGNEERSRDSAMRVQNAAKRMGELIDDVLTLSRVGRKEMIARKLIDLNVQMAGIREDLQGELDQAGASLVIEENLPTVYADPGEIRQVFQNLLINAIRYGCLEPGKTITVGARSLAAESHVFVRDEGPGIPKEYHARIFQLFQRLDQSVSGTGLGLAIVSKVMKSLGGHAWVESQRGKGSTFWLVFPKVTKPGKRSELT